SPRTFSVLGKGVSNFKDKLNCCGGKPHIIYAIAKPAYPLALWQLSRNTESKTFQIYDNTVSIVDSSFSYALVSFLLPGVDLLVV
ncbi:hypothetical protein ACJX0J_024490, partial [Zea mays]